MLKFGIIGGGSIANTHKRAAALDSLATLVAGCFSRNEHKNAQQAKDWNVPPERTYRCAEEMAFTESELDDKIDFVVISTPNESHYSAAKAFIELGIPVLCEKPMTITIEDAKSLTELAEKMDCPVCINYSYSGYPMITQARHMIENNEIGKVFKVVSEYIQDNQITSNANFKPWHLDPKIAGPTACVANIGTHIDYLVRYMTGFEIDEISTMFSYTLPDKPLETDFSAMVKYDSGAVGTMWGCKTAIGQDCNISVRIYGDKGSISWSHLKPDVLEVATLDGPVQTLVSGRPYLCDDAKRHIRLSNGQVEGYLLATANIYSEFVQHIKDRKSGNIAEKYIYPTQKDGLYGVLFSEACYQSHLKNGAWEKLDI